VDTWDKDVGEKLARGDRHVLEVKYPIGQNRTSAEPGIEVEVVPSLLDFEFVIEVGVEVS
jgi:hypothetical protein